MSTRLFRILSSLSCIVGCTMLTLSFAINSGPPPDATGAQLIAFGEQHSAAILWGAWLQAVGPLLIILFAFAIVCLAEATTRLAGWMTMFGGMILMAVSLIEIVFYITALDRNPTAMDLISTDIVDSVQHLYFIIASPALFLALGSVILSSRVLPQVLGYLALLLGAAFAILGVVFLLNPVLPAFVTAFAGVQIFWWLAAAIVLIVGTRKIPATTRITQKSAITVS